MKIIVKIIWVFFTGLISIQAQTNSISGKITSKGEALPFVNVYLTNTSIGTSTNEKGFFELKNIPNGNYTLIASSIGFKIEISKNLY